MSHFVRCDRCDVAEFHITPNLTLPPGWTKVLNADLCERCSEIVRDFIRFKPGDAAKLPVEPIPQEIKEPPAPSTDGTKLFETVPIETPESSQVDGVTNLPMSTGNAASAPVSRDESIGTREISPSSGINESSTEERAKTRKTKKRLAGVEAVIPPPAPPPADKRTGFPHGHNAEPQA